MTPTMKQALLLLMLFSWFSNSYASETLESVVLQLKWKHQFQFAGYYAADRLGYYENAGFNVELREHVVGTSDFDIVANGEATFGIADSSIVLQRMQNKPFVILSTVFQHSPLVFITLKEDQIRSPYELIGKNIMFRRNQDDASLMAMLTDMGISEDDYHWLPSTYDDLALLKDDVDAMSAYSTSQTFLYEQQGIDIRIIDPSNYGIDFYGDLIFGHQDYIEQHPERALAFVNASLQGWQYALANPEQVIEWILNDYGTDQSIEELRFEATATARMVANEFVSLGTLYRQRFDRIAAIYKDLGMVNAEANLNGLILDDYLVHKPLIKPLYLRIALVAAIVSALIALMLMAMNRRLASLVAARTTDLEASNVKLAYLSETDHLTGLGNRLKIDAVLADEWLRFERYKEPLSIILFDLDFFKRINDKLGHHEGDKVLQKVAKLTREHIRNIDTVGRWGGEEFLIVCPNTNRQGAQQLAEKLVYTFRDNDFTKRHSITASFGIASSEDGVSNVTDLMKLADTAMYHSKVAGRDQLTIASELTSANAL